MATFRLNLSNDVAGHEEPLNWVIDKVTGNITADAADRAEFTADAPGAIVSVGLSVRETGLDSTNPLFLEGDVKKNGTSILTTLPKIDKTAADRSSSFKADTGVTAAVLKTDGTATFAKGDLITFTFDLTRTASPTTEMADAVLQAGFKYHTS